MYMTDEEDHSTATKAHHWDVSICKVWKTEEGEEVEELSNGGLQQKFDWPVELVYDGNKNAYAPGLVLPQHETEHYVDLPPHPGRSRPRTFKVTLRWVTSHDLAAITQFCAGMDPSQAPRDALQAIDIALRHGSAVRPNCVPFGRAFYFNNPDGGNRWLGGGCEAWLGYQQALKPCQFGLALTVDTAATAFVIPQDLVTAMAEMLNLRGGPDELVQRGVNPQTLRRLKTQLKGIKVKSLYGKSKGREWTIKSIAEKPADKEVLEGTNTTVAQYFFDTYNITLTAPWLPCIEMVAKGKGAPKKCSIPPELLVIKSGQRRAKLDETQTSNMLKAAALEPREKAPKIKEAVQQLGLDTDPVIQAFGIKVSKELLQVDARILPAPILQYASKGGQQECLDVGTKGAWSLMDVSESAEAAELHSYAFVSFASQQDVDLPGPCGFTAFCKELLARLQASGIKVNDPETAPTIYANRQASVQDHLQAAVRAATQAYSRPPQIIFALLFGRETDVYTEVKRTSDSVLGIPSQVFLMRKANIGQNADPGKRGQYLGNVALKVNAKLGGTNAKLAGGSKVAIPVIGSKPFMIMGADVTHPVTRNSGEPSIAAVVASLNASVGQYACRVSAQTGRQETIDNLKEMTQELLRDFYTYQNRCKKPEAIVFFRDGVSEGQFKEVLETEYKAIRDACASMGDEDYAPPITFIIVQKRHNTRLLPAGRDCDNKGNVLPGTVVDRGITSAYEHDFLLNSHAGLQGTNRPANYHVLVDENGFGADGIQLLSYWLCYLYCRCTRSVSIATPAYYAHLAAFRGRMMVDYSGSDTASQSSVGSGHVAALQMAAIHKKLNNTMFYV